MLHSRRIEDNWVVDSCFLSSSGVSVSMWLNCVLNKYKLMQWQKCDSLLFSLKFRHGRHKSANSFKLRQTLSVHFLTCLKSKDANGNNFFLRKFCKFSKILALSSHFFQICSIWEANSILVGLHYILWLANPMAKILGFNVPMSKPPKPNKGWENSGVRK